MKKSILIASLLISSISFAQTITEEVLVQNLKDACTMPVETTNEIYFEDYLCEVNTFTRESNYIYISNPESTSIPTVISKSWEKSEIKISLAIEKLDEMTLLVYLNRIADVDYNIQKPNGYLKSWSDDHYVYDVEKDGDKVTISCHRYYKHLFASN